MLDFPRLQSCTVKSTPKSQCLLPGYLENPQEIPYKSPVNPQDPPDKPEGFRPKFLPRDAGNEIQNKPKSISNEPKNSRTVHLVCGSYLRTTRIYL